MKRLPLYLFPIIVLMMGFFWSSTALGGTNQWASHGLDDIRLLVPSPNFASDHTVFAVSYGNGIDPGVFKSTDGGSSWIPVDSGIGVSDQIMVNSLTISPNFATDGTIFAGTGGNGVFKSTNGGDSWIQVDNGLSSLTVNSLVVSPNFVTDGTIFAGTKDGGVFKSTNGGASWSAVNSGLSTTQINTVAVSPAFATDGTLFAVNDGAGIFKSTNGGSSWNQINTGLSSAYVRSFAVSPNFATDGTLIAGTLAGISKSTDGGSNWVNADSGLSNTDVFSVAISPSYASDGTIFAGVYGSYAVFKSTDGGGNWSVADAGLPAFNSYAGITALAISPDFANDSTVFAGSNALSGFKSVNGGASWTGLDGGLTDGEVMQLILSPNFANDGTVFAGSASGVFKSTNSGTSWSKVISATGVYYFSSLAISPNFATDGTIFAGFQGNGVFKSADGGNWNQVATGLSNLYIRALAISPDFTNDQTIFAGTDDGVFKSTDGGANWSQMNSGLSNLYTNSLSISPNFAIDQTIFVGTNDSSGGVYKSADGGATWSQASTGLPTTASSFSLAFSPSFASDDTLYVGTEPKNGTGGSIYKSTNGGASWSPANNGLPLFTPVSNLPVQYVSLAISPNFASDHTLFAGPGGAGLFESTDGGGNWSSVSGWLPLDTTVPTLAVPPDFASSNTIFAGVSEVGVFSNVLVATDTTPPAVSSVSPSGWVNTASTTISADYSDSGSGINTASVAVYLDGSPLTGCTAGATSVSCPTSGLSDGAHTITGSVSDNAGNTSTISGSFSIDTVAPTVSNVAPAGAISTALATISADYQDNSGGSGISTSSVIVNLDGSALYTGCTVTATSVSCPVAGLANGAHTISGQVADNAGNTSLINGSFTVGIPSVQQTSYFWTWYDNVGGDNWVLLANPSSAAGNLTYSLLIGGVPMNLSGYNNGVTGPGKSIEPMYAKTIGGPVKATASGGKGIASQRILWPKGGSSLEEVPGTEESRLSNDFYWTWYDNSSPGYTNWILVANPGQDRSGYPQGSVTATVKIAGQQVWSGTIKPGGNVTPTFPTKMGGPVEVTSTGGDVMASQRVLSNNGKAFNEAPGIPASSLSDDYLWTWYDNNSPGYTDWVLIANPGASAVTYRIKIGGSQVASGALGPGQRITPTFPTKMGGPVEVIASGNVIASQRAVAGPSLEEVPGYPKNALSGDYNWTWYDNASAGATNWILIANPGAVPVTYQIKIAGKNVPGGSGTLPAGGRVTPTFPGLMGGPVEVSASGNVMASQRVTWNGYFNEVLGQ